MAGKIQKDIPDNWREQKSVRPDHRVINSGPRPFPGNSVSEAPRANVDGPDVQQRSKPALPINRPVVPPNTAKDSVLGEHVQGPVSQRHGERRTINKGKVYDGTVHHSNREADPEIEI